MAWRFLVFAAHRGQRFQQGFKMRLFMFALAMFASGVVLPACEPPPPPPEGDQLAAFVQTLQVNEWAQIPNTALADVLQGGYGGTLNDVVTAWNGAAWSDNHASLYIAASGGHTDRYGSEVIKFDAYSVTWSVVADSNAYVSSTNSDPLANGTPAARHTYDGLEIDGDTLYVTGSCVGASCTAARPWSLDLNTLQYTQLPDYPQGSSISSAIANGVLYAADFESVKKYDGAWAAISPTYWEVDFYTPAVFSAVNNKIYFIGNGRVRTVNVNNGAYGSSSFTGCDFVATKAGGLDYGNQTIYGFNGNLYELNPQTNTCAQVLTLNAPPFTPNGVFGRFRYMQAYDAFIYVESAYSDVWVMRR